MMPVGRDDHERFEVLAALAAIGQIESSEYRELDEHLKECSNCRTRLSDFNAILHEHLPLTASPERILVEAAEFRRTATEYKARFIAQARREGIELAATEKSDSPLRAAWRDHLARFRAWQPHTMAFASAVFLLIVAVSLLGLTWRSSVLEREAAHQRIAGLDAEIANLKAESPQFITPHMESTRQEGGEKNKLQTQLFRTRLQKEATQARLTVYEKKLLEANTQLVSLRNELAEAKDKAKSAEKVRDLEQAFARVSDEMIRIKQGHSASVTLLANQQTQIQDLTSRLNLQSETIQQQQELLAVSREIRELMMARNFRMMDVQDFEAVSRQASRQPVGRIFYIEGKSLLFYAYDLKNQKRSLDKSCFQVWGQKNSRPNQVASLGILALDDESQNRWFLKVDDAKVLAEIDSLFVTIEPKGGSQKPRGQQLMYSYLRDTPNHP
jgi:hypothetical protein